MIGRAAADTGCRAAQESVLLLLLAVAPWALGGEEPAFRVAALTGVAALALLGALRLLLRPCHTAGDGPVVLALGGLFLLSAGQLVPLPPSVLGVIAPASFELQRDLLPARPEVFAGESAALAPPPGEWRAISLYPFATRTLLFDLLALFLIALVVRRQLGGPGSFRRLAWMAFVNGTALALVAIAQMLSAAPNVVYWSIPTGGAVFGPFICRNHFPFYVAMCLGLSAGLLTRSSRVDTAPPLSPLHDPRQLWIGSGMALMAVACLFSMSRGGALALAGSSLVVGAAAWKWRVGTSGRALALLSGAVLAVLIALWLGTVPLETRLATLGPSERTWDARWTLWANVLPHLRRFGLFGSGGGTFGLLEPMYRQQADAGEPYLAEYAHNEYLEAAFEGGLPRLALTLLLAAAPGWLARQRLRSRPRGAPALGILGAWWGLLTVALHSVFDFGLHLPAIALLATVMATHLSTPDGAPAAQPAAVRPGCRWAVAGLAAALALVLVWEGATAGLAEVFRRQAQALARSPRGEDRAAQLLYWEAALRLRPRDALLHESAAQAYLDVHRAGQDRRQQDERTLRLAGALFGGLPPGPAPESDLQRREASAQAHYLRQAAFHLVAARDRCPILALPHARLAELAPCLAVADSPVHYLEHAARLAPTEPDLWFALGRAYLDAGQDAAARQAWKRNLAMTDRSVRPILERAATVWSADEIRLLLPDRPETWLAAADILVPQEQRAEQRRPYLERALELLQSPAGADPALVLRRAQVQCRLRQTAAAEASYREALRLAPARSDWRLEFARFLREQGRLAEARAEIEMVLARSPDHAVARDALAVVKRELILRDH